MPAVKRAPASAGPDPYGWHWMLVHKATGQICNEGFTANRPGCVPPPKRMKAPIKGFVQIGVPVYKEPQ
jgi:hypothetical protein